MEPNVNVVILGACKRPEVHLVDLHEGSKFGAHLCRGSFGPRAFMMRHQGDIFYLRVEHKDGGAWRVFERRLRKKVRATGPYTR